MLTDIRTDPRYRHLDPALVRTQFEVERELRARLLAAPAEGRAEVFLTVYDELFERCPWHPALSERDGSRTAQPMRRLARTLQPFLPFHRGARVLEIGCGMGELLSALADIGYDCTGLDVSRTRIESLRSLGTPRLRFQRAEGSRLPFEDNSFDAVISIQLFEHLHPEDAAMHLRETHRVLKPGGRYLLETPNRWVGPGDVSRFFATRPLGFHLREYSISELCSLMTASGYSRVSVVRWRRHVVDSTVAVRLERAWRLLPGRVRRKRSFGLHNPLYVGWKASPGDSPNNALSIFWDAGNGCATMKKPRLPSTGNQT